MVSPTRANKYEGTSSGHVNVLIIGQDISPEKRIAYFYLPVDHPSILKNEFAAALLPEKPLIQVSVNREVHPVSACPGGEEDPVDYLQAVYAFRTRCQKLNTPGANANGVKELVIAAMLLASRDIVGGIEWVKENASDAAINKSAEKAKKAFAGTEIQGKRLGVIGLGAIGQKVANAAVALGMEVFGYDPYLSVDAAWNLDHAVKHCKNVEAIYRACDFITIHVPALDSTKGMINAEEHVVFFASAIFL